MKKLLLLLLMFYGFKGFSQKNDHNYFGLIKLYPLNYFVGHWNAGFEYIINNNTTLELNGSIYNKDRFMLGYDEYDYYLTEVSGFALRLTYRGYIGEEAPSGGYLAPQVMFKTVTSEPQSYFDYSYRDSVIYHRNIYAFKILAGYQFKVIKMLFVDFYTGVGIRTLTGWKDKYYEAVKIYQTDNWHEEIPAGKSVINYGGHPPVSIHLGFTLSIAL